MERNNINTAAEPNAGGRSPSHSPSPPPNASDARARKRHRADMIYPRKRAQVACRRCRGRKTRCDGVRPACNFCVSVSASCVYPDSNPGFSSFDPASITIIERLDHLEGLINAGFSSLEGTTDASPQGTSTSYVHSSEARSTPGVTVPPFDRLPASEGAHFGRHTIPTQPQTGSSVDDASRNAPQADSDFITNHWVDIVAKHLIPEAILRWPIFSGPNTLSAEFTPWKHDAKSTSNLGTAMGILPELVNQDPIEAEVEVRGEMLEDLCRKFLKYVHSKNPIFAINDFMDVVREVSQNGLGWDGNSCLVLLASALGAISYPFSPYEAGFESFVFPPNHDSFKKISIVYFTAACKRIGLLQPSLLGVQCYFLRGMYEMYTVSPRQAWLSFSQAGLHFKLYQVASQTTNENFAQPSPTHSLEKRLYWSCAQSEYEVRAELQIVASGLETLHLPYDFPSPPEQTQHGYQDPSPGQTNLKYMFSGSSSESGDPERVRSWMFYLAETSLRRIFGRIISAIYKNGESFWVQNIQMLVDQAQECSDDLRKWNAHLPQPLRPNEALSASDNELAFHIRSRFIMCRTWVQLPFLFLMIHYPKSSFVGNEHVIESLASKCMEDCILMLRVPTLYHRHHGSWLTLRIAACCALCLVAAARCRNIPMPPDWLDATWRGVTILKLWGSEAPDLKVLADILERLCGDFAPPQDYRNQLPLL